MKHTIITSPQAPQPIGPYSQAREWNGFIFLSGQIAIQPHSGQLEQTNVQTETTQIMANIQSVLEAAGVGMDDIVKTTIYLTDMTDFKAVNEVYAKSFDRYFPARETVQVSALPLGARVEISCIAAAKKS
jgi:2-iminobutanoate/2-iminopropanoate deaminase